MHKRSPHNVFRNPVDGPSDDASSPAPASPRGDGIACRQPLVPSRREGAKRRRARGRAQAANDPFSLSFQRGHAHRMRFVTDNGH